MRHREKAKKEVAVKKLAKNGAITIANKAIELWFFKFEIIRDYLIICYYYFCN